MIEFSKEETRYSQKKNEIFRNLTKDINLHNQKAELIPNRINKKSTPTHITIKLLKTKDKDKILKAIREK